MLKANGSMQVSHGRLSVEQDPSGGVRIGLMGASFVLSPREAVGFATALLKAAGMDVSFKHIAIRDDLRAE